MRNTRYLGWVVIAAAFACPVRTAGAADGAVTPGQQQLDAIFAPWSGAATPGCAVAVSRDGVLEQARGYGMADLDHGLPITPQSVFWVASISKQFTAFSVGLLAQEGKLSLDDDIRKYLPEMPDFGRTITIRHLIHHTNGLREQGQLLNLAGWRGDDLYTERDILWALTRQRGLNFEPGSEVVYGNAAYTLLGVIVRRVSGQSLKSFAEARIFKPMGMIDTRFADDHTEVVPRRALAYSPRDGGGWRENLFHYDHYGSTGLLTTVGDLLKWEQNLLDARVGGPALVTWMRTSGQLNDGTVIGYGGGLRLGDYRGLPVVSHDGADGGYRTEAALFPDQRLAIVALCNGATIDPTELTRRIADAYLAGQMRSAALAPAVQVPSSAEQGAWAGVYWSAQTDEVLRIEWRDGALRQMGSSTPLVPIGDRVFRPGEAPQEWRFVPAAAGGQPELHVRDFWPTYRVFSRVDLPRPDLATLNTLAGQYRSHETDTTYTVRVAGGGLRLSWPRQYDLLLEAIGGDRFVSPRGTVTFTRTASGEVVGLTISNRRLRRLVVQRLPEAGAVVGPVGKVGMVDDACPSPMVIPAAVAAWDEALLASGPFDRAALSAHMQRDAEAQAYQKAQQVWATRDWAKLCRYRADNRRLLASGQPVQAVFLGDSITENWVKADPALFSSSGWVGRGISGQTSAQTLVRFQADVVALRPRWVHILAGTNDVAGNGGPTTAQDFENNIMAMAQLARANGIAVVLGTIPPAKRFSWRPEVDAAPRIAALNAWLRAYARQQGLGFVDYHAALVRDGDLPAEYGNDGVHPNRQGYAVMRRLVQAAAAAADSSGASSSRSAPSRGAL